MTTVQTKPRLSPIARTTRGALIAYVGPRMAQDQAIPDFRPILEGVTAKNFDSMLPTIERKVKRLVSGKLAQDMEIMDIMPLLEHLEENKGEDMEAEAESSGGGPDDIENEPWSEAKDDDHEMVSKIKAMLEGHVSPELMAKIDEMAGAGSEDDDCENMMEDEVWDRRADDARHRLGRDETPEEEANRMEKEGAEDARHRLGRDEDDDEAEDRRHRAEDSRKRRGARDKKRAEDRMEADDKMRAEDEDEDAAEYRHRAEDKKHRAEDRKRAVDAGRRMVRDAKRRAGDARREADDKKRHADDRKRAEDRFKKAEDKRRKAEDGMRRMGRDDPPEFPGKPETGGGMAPMRAQDIKLLVRQTAKQAHDEAIAQMREVQVAERFVSPWIGQFRRDMAFDSAQEVFHETLSALGVKHDKKWPQEALKALLIAIPKPSSQGTGSPSYMAHDAKPSDKSFSERFAFTNRARA